MAHEQAILFWGKISDNLNLINKIICREACVAWLDITPAANL